MLFSGLFRLEVKRSLAGEGLVNELKQLGGVFQIFEVVLSGELVHEESVLGVNHFLCLKFILCNVIVVGLGREDLVRLQASVNELFLGLTFNLFDLLQVRLEQVDVVLLKGSHEEGLRLFVQYVHGGLHLLFCAHHKQDVLLARLFLRLIILVSVHVNRFHLACLGQTSKKLVIRVAAVNFRVAVNE